MSIIDVVAIYDSKSFQQLFNEVLPMKAEVRETSKVMMHPVETGVMLSDHHIINPREVDLQIIISSDAYGSVYQQLKSAFIAATLLSVQTRADIYPNMIIASMPHEETPEMFDVIVMSLRMVEVLYVIPTSSPSAATPAAYAPADPVDDDTVQRGQQVCTPSDPSGLGQHGATGAW